MRRLMIVILAGMTLLSACDKKSPEPNERDAAIHFTVVDEHGNPQGGIPILIFDEKGYENFKKDRKTEPLGFTLTLPDGNVSYRLPYQIWFTAGSREVTFVVMEEADADNYRIWAISRTVGTAEQVKIRFELDRSGSPTPPAGEIQPDEPGKPGDSGDSGETGNPGSPTSPAESEATLLEMFNEENGHTLFGGALFLDKEFCFDGGNRYSIIDAGKTGSLGELTLQSLDRMATRINAYPGHGYFFCKNISLMEFPSGKRALDIGSQYARVYAPDWITRNGQPVGVEIRYTVETVPAGDLPAWGTVYEVKVASERTISLPLTARDSDSECVPKGRMPLQISYSSDRVTIRIADPRAAVGKEYPFLLRNGARYTEGVLKLVE